MSSRATRLVPIALGLAMLAVVIAAALAPNTGVVQAQTNQQYVSPSSSSGVSPYVYLGIAAAVIIAGLLLALLLLSRRRRKPPAGTTVQPWQEGPTPPPGAMPPPPPPTAPPAAAPAYLETPEDVGHAPPAVPVSKAGAAAGAAAPAAAEGEPDIDSLMAELDKISSEILKRAPKKGSGGQAATEETAQDTNR